jgi:hypothetical protein
MALCFALAPEGHVDNPYTGIIVFLIIPVASRGPAAKPTRYSFNCTKYS